MKEKPENPAKVNLKNISKFLQGYARKLSDSFGLLPDYKKEQVLWRMEAAKPCTENGSCLYCGCDTPARYYSDEACEDPVKQCYPDMMSEAEWIEYKTKHNISINGPDNNRTSDTGPG